LGREDGAMSKVWGRVVILVLLLPAMLYFALPTIFHALGMHPTYHGVAYTMPPGSKALIVTTSHTQLGDTGRKTGVFSSELTWPYYTFLDAGMQVDVATITGGAVPFDPVSFIWCVEAPSDKRSLKDPNFAAKTGHTPRIDDVDVTAYDIVCLAGGWGAAFDLGTSAALGEKITQAWAAGKVVGGICHGPLGLLLARDEQGAPLVRGRRVTAVTDRQVQQLGITLTPQHPERELRAAGARFEGQTKWLEILANHAVQDGHLVTGQNQNAGEEVAELMMAAAGGRPKQR
jgi:putative intracellular protease/amidase